MMLVACLLLSLALGCSHDTCYRESLADRILPPANVAGPQQVEQVDPPQKSAQQPPEQGPALSVQAVPSDQPRSEGAKPPPPVPVSEVGYNCTPILNLAEAIDTAFRQQPRLRVYLESVEQARRGQDIALAPFFPLAMASYSVGGFDLNVSGNTPPLAPPPGFTFIPALGSIPIGLNINTPYELADLKLQWLICDFGRRLGRYHQAGLAVEIAQLQ